LKSNIFSSIIGLRFDNISIVHNSTHSYAVKNAYLSLYSDHVPLSYEDESGKVTIYFERDKDDIQTFSNYTELVSRSPSYNYRTWDLDNVHGERTTGRWNDSPNLDILVSNAVSFDNDTICFLIYSDRGVWFRYFRTIDCFVDYAPRLHIIYYIYKWEESPPSGYDDYDFVETYKDLDIWEVNTTDWLDYSTFTLTNPDNNIADLNSTYFTYTTFYEDDDDYLRKTFTDSGIISRKFGITYTEFKDNTASESSSIVLHWGVGNVSSPPWGPPYWGEGYSVATLQATSSIEKLQIVSWVNGGHHTHIDLHPYWNTADLPATIWVHVNLNLDTGAYNIILYNDEEMINVNQTTSGTFGSVPDSSLFITEFAIAPTTSTSTFRDYESGIRLSKEPLHQFMVTDEEGDIIIILTDPNNTVEDVREWIDNYLSASPEYDKSPWMGDFTLLLVGLVGIAFIPLGFLIFVSSARDGDIIGGLQTLVLMFFIGIGCIITWLWA